MSEWAVCGVVGEGHEINVGGVNPWNFPWVSHRRSVELPDPVYPHQRNSLHVYEINVGGKRIVFAAGELSASVWGFYIPTGSPTQP